MRLSTNVGQIFLVHPADQNYTNLYEEVFSKFGETVELFAVLEVADMPPNKLAKAEYEKLSRTVVSVFKKAYVSSPTLDQESFERALGHINAALSRLASRGKVSWFNKLNIALAALTKNTLSISVTGNAQVILARGQELVFLSEGLEAPRLSPVKIFANYSTGKLTNLDRVILSTNQLFNFLSLERIKEFLAEDSLQETCQEIIEELKDVQDVGFATFIFELKTSASGLAEQGRVIAPQPQQVPASTASQAVKFLLSAGSFVLLVLKMLASLLINVVVRLSFLWRRRQWGRRPSTKKAILATLVVLLVLLLGNIGYGFFKKSAQEKRSQEQDQLDQAQEKLNEAEAALIYGDEQRILNLIQETETLLLSVRKEAEARTAVEDRLNDLKDKIAKQTEVEPVVLGQFANIPTDLIRSPNGILGYNRHSGSMSFYNFVSGEVRQLLKNLNLSHLLAGGFVGGDHRYVFLDREGFFEKLDPDKEELVKYDTANASLAMNEAKIQTLEVLGEADTARIYVLDTGQQQIWRAGVGEQGPGQAEAWFKETGQNLQAAEDFAVDGSIYLLYPDRVEKYFNGQKQSFELSSLLPPLEKAQRIFTRPEYQFLYILEGEKNRVLIFDKQGELSRQLLSPKFRELSDIFVDEKNRIIYLLSGSELLQVSLP